MARDTDDIRTTPTGAETERDDRFARDPAGERTYPSERTTGGGGMGGGTALAWLLGIGVIIALAVAIWAWVDDDSAGPDVGATVNEIAEDPGVWYGNTVTVSGEIQDIIPLPAINVTGQQQGQQQQGATGQQGQQQQGQAEQQQQGQAEQQQGATGQQRDQAQAQQNQGQLGQQTQTGQQSGVAFTIGGDSFGEQLLVVGANAPYLYLNEDSVVQVTGTVRQFNPTTFNESFGFGGDANGWFNDDFFGDWEGRPAVVAQSIDPTVPQGNVD